MPDRLRKCSVCEKHTFVLTTKSCCHCGQEFDADALPSAEEIAAYMKRFQPSGSEEISAKMIAEEKRNIEWARKHKPKQPVVRVAVEEFEEHYVWLSLLFIPSIFCGFYTNEFAEYNFFMKILGGFAAGFLYFVVSTVAVDLGFNRATGILAILIHIIAWVWFYYWAIYESSLTQAFVGPILILSTIGRLMLYVSRFRDLKAR